MSQTITQKILAKHAHGAKKEEVYPGEFIEVKVDVALANDITAPLAIKQFERIGRRKVFDRNRVVIVLDHFTPNKDILSAQQCKFIREFALKQKLKNYFDGGCAGIEHALLPEQGIVLPGYVVIGADSHTCTYGALGAFSSGVGSTDIAAVWATGKIWLKVPEAIKFVYYNKKKRWVYGKDLILYTIGKIGVEGANYKSMEFTGDTIQYTTMAERLTMCNMAVEAGAKNGIIQPDEVTLEYVRKVLAQGRPASGWQSSKFKAKGMKFYESDKDAQYIETVEIDVSKIEPQVAFPHLPSNTRPVADSGNISIDQVVIGSCTNGFLEDLEIAAKILKNKKIHPYVRLLIFPATPDIYRAALKKGLLETFLKAGGIINPPSCGPCLGGHLGILAKGERCVATTNRNFVGRMGHAESEVYLVNPATAAASAIKGRIAHPEEAV